MKKTHSNISNPSDWGKWRVEPDGVVTNGKMLRIFSAGGTKAKMQIGNFIAAAPEMYEMLKCISDWCAKNPGQWVVTKSEVDEVLKKARGEK